MKLENTTISQPSFQNLIVDQVDQLSHEDDLEWLHIFPKYTVLF